MYECHCGRGQESIGDAQEMKTNLGKKEQFESSPYSFSTVFLHNWVCAAGSFKV